MKADPHSAPKHAPEDVPTPEPLKGHFNWAVIGGSGVGKSTFINTFLGKKPRSNGAARVGVKETTTEPEEYKIDLGHIEQLRFGKKLPFIHKLGKIRLWDMPGANTEKHPLNTYIEDKNLRWFDGIVILTATRFTATDKFLVQELAKFEVPFYCVRNKMDQDVESMLRDKDEDESDEKVRESRFKECLEDQEENLENIPHAKGRIFLIAASRVLNSTSMYDLWTTKFRELQQCMLREMCQRRTAKLPPFTPGRSQEDSARTDCEVVEVTAEVAADMQQLMTDSAQCCCPIFDKLQIKSVHRIENPSLFEKHCNAVEEIQTDHRRTGARPVKTVTLPDRHVVEKATNEVNEVMVFHGTEKKIADILVVQGFDDKVVKHTGNLYGSGLYFSPSACKAVQYTRKEDRDKKQRKLGPHSRYLLLCRVALGRRKTAIGRPVWRIAEVLVLMPDAIPSWQTRAYQTGAAHRTTKSLWCFMAVRCTRSTSLNFPGNDPRESWVYCI